MVELQDILSIYPNVPEDEYPTKNLSCIFILVLGTFFPGVVIFITLIILK
jgi:hypothetical protein